MQEEGGSDPRVGGGQGWEGATALERDDQEEGRPSGCGNS
jgi:hypothetical protein